MDIMDALKPKRAQLQLQLHSAQQTSVHRSPQPFGLGVVAAAS
jgi:hypothetical protein